MPNKIIQLKTCQFSQWTFSNEEITMDEYIKKNVQRL